MVAYRVLVCFAVLAASAVAINFQQCPGQSFDNLSENVQLSPCKKTPCRLKRGTDQAIMINFTPSQDLAALKNHVIAEVIGVNFPFVGVDGVSICDKLHTDDGEKASCPLKAGTRYTYNDTFPVFSFYPTISAKVRWALQDKDDKDLICFEVPVRIY